MRPHLLPLLLLVLAVPFLATAQQPPQLAAGVAANPRAQEIRRTACTVEEKDDDEPRTSELPSCQTQWQAEYALRRAYRTLFPKFLAAVPSERDAVVLMLVADVTMGQVSDTWGAARSEGRTHEGTDIFAPAGTPDYAATPGYVQRIGSNPVGGNFVRARGGAVRHAGNAARLCGQHRECRGDPAASAPWYLRR